MTNYKSKLLPLIAVGASLLPGCGTTYKTIGAETPTKAPEATLVQPADYKAEVAKMLIQEAFPTLKPAMQLTDIVQKVIEQSE